MSLKTVYGLQMMGPSLEVIKWPSKKQALKSGNNWMLIETVDDLTNSSISSGRLAEYWNHHNPDTPVKDFKDREEGAKQLFAILERVAITAKKMSKAPQDAPKSEEEERYTSQPDDGEPPPEGKEETVAKTATKRKGAAAAPPKGKKAAAVSAAREKGAKGKGNVANLTPKTGKYAGMKLTASKDAQKENPRRPGSEGWKSLEIIRKKPGISYEDFRKAGGHPGQLNLDVTNGNIIAKS